MSFFVVDDDLTTNRKFVGLVDGSTPIAALAAMGLWTAMGSVCRKAGLDGVVTLAQCARVTTDRKVAAKLAGTLVAGGFWHAPGHACDICPQPPEGAWVFHDWFRFGYGTGEQERVKADKLRELRSAAIVEAVWARDTDATGKARCRYCARIVRRPTPGRGGDRRSEDLGQLDHVDPTQAIGASNIVLACPPCNRTKGQRTPEQAGMTLLPPPPRSTGNQRPDQPDDQSGINPQINPESTSEVCSPGARRARVRAGGVLVGEKKGSGEAEPAALAGRPLGRAGPAPSVPVASAFPSTLQHPGPPPTDDVLVGSTCPAHQLPMPCRLCMHKE